ncbi:MAG: glycosyltransferase family 4 protein [Spirochaetaceae bacterium]|jgi:glycosyltransferase involved in cell wall biosynthesis|nr:glycosyltransferase family 4 protein [Spirochaetaceae bacterium]
MKITIDCRFLNASGVGVYLQGCLPYFLDSPHSFLLLGDAEKLRCFTAGHKNCAVIPCGIKPFSIAELLAFPAHLKRAINKTDLYYSPYFNIPGGVTVPVYTTIHDIIFPDMPELVSKAGLAARMWFYHRAFRRSKKIFTVSHFSKSRIEHFLGNIKPVVVTHTAILPYLLDFQKIEKTEKILFIGNIKKHKGLSYLLDAFIAARAEGLPHKLVIVGSKDNFRSADTSMPAKLEQADSFGVEFTGLLSNEKLKTLLAEAALLVQPSLYEGFGLPPLEAMVTGTQALVSDIPVFKEIYDVFPVTFFRAGDVSDLKEKLMNLLYAQEPRNLVLSDDLAEKYTFKKTAAIILENIHEACPATLLTA